MSVTFQCSSASRKFLNCTPARPPSPPRSVSVLFSEPKIPQSGWQTLTRANFTCFSALQRAENSSIRHENGAATCGRQVSVLFSEPKIPQCQARVRRLRRLRVSVLFSEPKIPQCKPKRLTHPNGGSFSALQRAENSSMELGVWESKSNDRFQCSSASRKFLNGNKARRAVNGSAVSVLFSEPKIPQSRPAAGDATELVFQCSSASRKFLNLTLCNRLLSSVPVSVLFSEPKIPQSYFQNCFQ